MRSMTRTRKRMSLSPQTIRVQHRLAEVTKSGRKHWIYTDGCGIPFFFTMPRGL